MKAKPSPNGRPTTEEELRQHARVVNNHSASRFLFFRQDHCLYLKGNCNAAAVLAFILNLFRMKTENPKDRKRLLKEGLWFKCPAKNIQAYFGMGKDKQQSAITTLETAGLIKAIHKKGIPPSLWVCINTAKLEEIEELSALPKSGETPHINGDSSKGGKPSQRKEGNPPNGRRETLPSIREESSEESSGETSPPPSPTFMEEREGRGIPAKPAKAAPLERKEEAKTEHLAATKRLNSALRDNNRQVTSPSPHSGAEHFRLLEEQDKQDYQPVLDWYCRHCSKQEQERLHLPAIASAKQFRERFNWLEDCYRRYAGEDGEAPKRKWTLEDEFPTGRCLITDLGENKKGEKLIRSETKKPPYSQYKLKPNQHWKDEEDNADY